MKKGFFIIVIIVTTIALLGFGRTYPQRDNYVSDTLYFYKLATLNKARDTLSMYCFNRQISADTTFSVPIYKFQKYEKALMLERLFDSLLLYDSYSLMTLNELKRTNRLIIKVQFLEDSEYSNIKGVYLPKICNKPLILMNLPDTILTRLMLERSVDSITLNVKIGNYIIWEQDSAELSAKFSFYDSTRFAIQGPFRNHMPILGSNEDTVLYDKFKWLLEYRY